MSGASGNGRRENASRSVNIAATQLPPLSIHMLGKFSVLVADQSVLTEHWRLRKAQSLVKILALSPEKTIARDRTIELLWPGLDPASGLNNLHQAIHAARRALSIEPYVDFGHQAILVEKNALRLNDEIPLFIDVDEFERLADYAYKSMELSVCLRATECYFGDLLPDDPYEDWAIERRRSLRRTHLSLLLKIAELHRERDDYAAAIEVLQRLVSIDPLHEEAHRILMEQLARSGKRVDALRQYHALTAILDERLGTEPSRPTQQLFQEIQSRRSSDTPDTQFSGFALDPMSAAASRLVTLPLDASRSNLPVQLSSFIGRERELADVASVMASSRLLTLTGPGGVGKTRLAMEAGKNLIPNYPDGVWLVDLSFTISSQSIPAVILSTIDAGNAIGLSLEHALVESLRERRLLLILDNCEHVAVEVSRIVELVLGTCPGVRILATSRQPLMTVGESVRFVAPLPVPALTSRPEMISESENEALQLFIERVRQVRPRFGLNSENARRVISICRQLDGLPLSLELAAALARSLTIAQLESRLKNSLSLLDSGGSSVARRHRSIRATIQWSYSLLDEREQHLLAILSVFAGPFTLDAVENVCLEQGTARDEVVHLLHGLVNKSLVLVEDHGNTMRFRLLEVIRQFGQSLLEQDSRATELSQRHAEYYASLAARAESGLREAEQNYWMNLLDAELENIRSALFWGTHAPEGHESAARLAATLLQFWELRGYIKEGLHWHEELLKVSGILTEQTHARLVSSAGLLSRDQARFRIAEQRVNQALDIFRRLGDMRGVATTLTNLGVICWEQRWLNRAYEHFSESLRLFRSLDATWNIANLLHNLALVHHARGDSLKAMGYLDEALDLWRTVGDHSREAQSLSYAGEVLHRLGNTDRAFAMVQQSLRIRRELNDRSGLTYSLYRLGRIARRNEEYCDAALALAEGIQLAYELGALRQLRDCMCEFVAVVVGQKRHETAARLIGAIDSLNVRIDAPLASELQSELTMLLDEIRAALDSGSFESGIVWGQTHPLDDVMSWISAIAIDDYDPIEIATNLVAQKSPGALLTRRELEICELIVFGLTNGQIAHQLSIAERTVDTHVSHILHKVSLSTRTQVATWMLEQRAVE